VSHVTTTQAPIPLRDKNAIVAAAKKLGCQVLFDAEAVGWANQVHRGEIVLKHPSCRYDVALNRNEQGVYEFNADLMGNEVGRVYGTPEHVYGRLIALYGAEVVRKLALLRGYRVEQKVDEKTGTVIQRVVIGNV